MIFSPIGIKSEISNREISRILSKTCARLLMAIFPNTYQKVNKQIAMYLYTGILFSNRKNEVVLHTIDESQNNFADSKKPDQKKNEHSIIRFI